MSEMLSNHNTIDTSLYYLFITVRKPQIKLSSSSLKPQWYGNCCHHALKLSTVNCCRVGLVIALHQVLS